MCLTVERSEGKSDGETETEGMRGRWSIRINQKPPASVVTYSSPTSAHKQSSMDILKIHILRTVSSLILKTVSTFLLLPFCFH